jgi:hypothetical protein
MMKARVSTIESYRRLVENQYGDEDEMEADLIDSIRKGQDTPAKSWQMEAGTAWHKTLQFWGPQMATGLSVNGYIGMGKFVFSGDAVREAVTLRGPGILEQRSESAFYTTRGPLVVTGQADHWLGMTIRDAKTKFSTPDASDYEPSLQWRFYLRLFNCRQFVYDLFHFKDPDETGFCELKNVLSFSFWSYCEMPQDLLMWCERFTQWADHKGLTGCLEEYGNRLPGEQTVKEGGES